MPRPTYQEAFKFWLKLGFISFGGPAGQIAIMHEFLVEKKKWISDRRFLHALNYCMLLPGPEAQQLATYTGWMLHGTLGGITAGLLFILPSLFLLAGLSAAYVVFGKLAIVTSLFYGLKPAVTAIIVVALIKIGKKSLLSVFHFVVAALSFICIFFANISFPLIILMAIAIGFAGKKFFPSLFKVRKDEQQVQLDESSYAINAFTPASSSGLTWQSFLLKIFSGLVLWAMPFALFYFILPGFSFWSTLGFFFTKAAFVTFGGAYAVLPYVAQESVEKFHWLTQYEMIDGLALGESTPGPLIIILVFVGFMAGYRHGHDSLAYGMIGLFTTAFFTFLPSFLFILIGAPWVEKTKDDVNLKTILSIVTAAVVGVMLNLTIYFSGAILFPHGLQRPDWFALSWLVVSLLALLRFKVNMISWIVVSAIAGLIVRLILP